MIDRTLLKRILGIVAVVGVLVGAWLLVSLSTSQSGRNAYSADFNRVTGLVQYSDIMIAGAKVGEVSVIKVSADGTSATITLAVDADVPLQEDASAAIRIKSLLGEQFIELQPGTSSKELPPGGRITDTVSDLSLDDLLQTVSGLLGDISDSGTVARLAGELSESFKGRGKDLELIMENTQILLSAMADRSDSLGRIIANLDVLTESLDGRAAALGEGISTAAETLRTLRGSLTTQADQINKTVADLKATLEGIDTGKIDQTLADIPDYIAKIERLNNDLVALADRELPLESIFVSLPFNEGDMRVFDRNMAKLMVTLRGIPGVGDSLKRELEWVRDNWIVAR